jgi:hypothetical protein
MQQFRKGAQPINPPQKLWYGTKPSQPFAAKIKHPGHTLAWVFFAGQQNTSLARKLKDRCLDVHHHPCLLFGCMRTNLGKRRHYCYRRNKMLSN